MSDEDRRFDDAVSLIVERRARIDLKALESGDWAAVCAIGEESTSSYMKGLRARPGENAFDYFIDSGSTHWGPGVGALAFWYPDGVEVRPLSKLSVNMGSPINRCVTKGESVLVYSPNYGWHFEGYTALPSALGEARTRLP